METVGSNQSQSCQSEETGEDHEDPPRNAVGINAKTVESERQSKSASILGGVGWSGFGAGTLQAQLGHFEVESGGIHKYL